MNYEKKYKEALERARELQENSNGMILKKWLWGVFPELKESEDEKIKKEIIRIFKGETRYTSKEDADKYIAWLEKQSKKKSADEVLKIRQELYQSGYNDGYKHGYDHGQNNIAIALGKESIDALEHFVRSIGESGYASTYDNRTKLVYRLLEQLKQIVK